MKFLLLVKIFSIWFAAISIIDKNFELQFILFHLFDLSRYTLFKRSNARDFMWINSLFKIQHRNKSAAVKSGERGGQRWPPPATINGKPKYCFNKFWTFALTWGRATPGLKVLHNWPSLTSSYEGFKMFIYMKSRAFVLLNNV